MTTTPCYEIMVEQGQALVKQRPTRQKNNLQPLCVNNGAKSYYKTLNRVRKFFVTVCVVIVEPGQALVEQRQTRQEDNL